MLISLSNLNIWYHFQFGFGVRERERERERERSLFWVKLNWFLIGMHEVGWQIWKEFGLVLGSCLMKLEKMRSRKKIRVKETCSWGKKKREVKKKSKRWFEWDMWTCKEVYKMKISIILGHNKLSQNFHNNWDIKSFICENKIINIRLRLTTTKNWVLWKYVTFYCISRLFKLVLISLEKK